MGRGNDASDPWRGPGSTCPVCMAVASRTAGRVHACVRRRTTGQGSLTCHACMRVHGFAMDARESSTATTGASTSLGGQPAPPCRRLRGPPPRWACETPGRQARPGCPLHGASARRLPRRCKHMSTTQGARAQIQNRTRASPSKLSSPPRRAQVHGRTITPRTCTAARKTLARPSRTLAVPLGGAAACATPASPA